MEQCKAYWHQLKVATIALVLLFAYFGQAEARPEQPYRVSPRDRIVAYHPDNYSVAYRRFASRAKNGDAIAQNNLGHMYADGRGVPRDVQKAIYWYNRSAEHGFGPAKVNLGVVYLYGLGKLAANKEKACHWFKEAANQSNNDATDFYSAHCVTV
jgi:TPR repeat protein